jgi:hypothetical protein
VNVLAAVAEFLRSFAVLNLIADPMVLMFHRSLFAPVELLNQSESITDSS